MILALTIAVVVVVAACTYIGRTMYVRQRYENATRERLRALR
jgi:hypothetical protein